MKTVKNIQPGTVIGFSRTTVIQKATILKAEYDNSGIWGHIAISLGHSPDTEEIDVVSLEETLAIPFPKNSDIDKNLKFHKEARWFIDRLASFKSMSKEEIIAVCDMAAIIVRQETFDF